MDTDTRTTDALARAFLDDDGPIHVEVKGRQPWTRHGLHKLLPGAAAALVALAPGPAVADPPAFDYQESPTRIIVEDDVNLDAMPASRTFLAEADTPDHAIIAIGAWRDYRSPGLDERETRILRDAMQQAGFGLEHGLTGSRSMAAEAYVDGHPQMESYWPGKMADFDVGNGYHGGRLTGVVRLGDPRKTVDKLMDGIENTRTTSEHRRVADHGGADAGRDSEPPAQWNPAILYELITLHESAHVVMKHYAQTTRAVAGLAADGVSQEAIPAQVRPHRLGHERAADAVAAMMLLRQYGDAARAYVEDWRDYRWQEKHAPAGTAAPDHVHYTTPTLQAILDAHAKGVDFAAMDADTIIGHARAAAESPDGRPAFDGAPRTAPPNLDGPGEPGAALLAQTAPPVSANPVLAKSRSMGDTVLQQVRRGEGLSEDNERAPRRTGPAPGS